MSDDTNDLLKPIRELEKQLRASGYASHECGPETSQGVQYWHKRIRDVYLEFADELTALLTGLDKSLKEMQQQITECDRINYETLESMRQMQLPMDCDHVKACWFPIARCQGCGQYREDRHSSDEDGLNECGPISDVGYCQSCRKQEQAVAAAEEAGYAQGWQDRYHANAADKCKPLGALKRYEEQAVAAVQSVLEHDRTEVAKCVTAVADALKNYQWLIEGRGSYEWDDDRWQKEFGFACENISKAMEPMVRIAADWSNCPKSDAEVQAARKLLTPDEVQVVKNQKYLEGRLAEARLYEEVTAQPALESLNDFARRRASDLQIQFDEAAGR